MKFTKKDRVILIIDRVLLVIGMLSFLWVQTLQRDFRILVIGLICCLGLFFTSRYMLVNFKDTE